MRFCSPSRFGLQQLFLCALWAHMSRSCSWVYRWTEGDATYRWTLLLENGVWWMIDTDGETRLVDTEEAHMYYYNAALRRWIDLESHPCRLDWPLWHDLATVILPHINSKLESGEWTESKIEEWSSIGMTRRYGPVSSFCMAIIVDIALEIQLLLGLGVKACWEVERRRMVPKADLLEAVMGLRDKYPIGWKAWGDMVDHLCTVVYEAWPHRAPYVWLWDYSHAFQLIFAHFDLEAFSAWHNQDAKSKSRMAAHVALQLRIAHPVVQLICSFL